MSKDQGYSLVILLVSIIVLLGYLAAFFAPFLDLAASWKDWAVGIPVLLFVLLVLAISGWIGWTMATTPPPAPMGPQPSPRTPNSAAASKRSKYGYPTTKLITQLNSVHYKMAGTGEMLFESSGNHDDYFWALALAIHSTRNNIYLNRNPITRSQ